MFDNQSQLGNYDAIVIGSGISGLTISLILAKEGKKVALFEKDREIAPLIRPYKRKGCECIPGFHITGWIDDGEVIAAFFKYLNVSDGVERELYETGFGDIVVGLNKYHIPRGFDNVEKSLLSYFPENTQAIRNYMRLIKEINEQSFYFNHQLTPNLKSNRQFISSDNSTLEERLKQLDASQELIDLLGTFTNFLIGSKADEIPFEMHAFVAGGFYKSPGIFTINGLNRLLANFKRELARLGVDLFTNSEVDEILIGNDKNVTGVKTMDGNQYFSSTIIASFNPKLLKEKVKRDVLRPVYRRRLDEAENTFGMYVAFYKIEDDKDIEIDKLVYYNESLDINLGTASNISGENKVFCVFLADNDQNIPRDIPERKKRAEEKLALLESIVYDAIPALQGKMILLDFVKPWSFERYTKTINGSAYGIKQTINSIGFQHRVPVSGLYLVGQAIYPGFLGSMLSSFSLACELLDADEFWPRVINR